MSLLRCIVLLLVSATLVLGQTGDEKKPLTQPTKPEAVVRSLYRQVVARHPIGIPSGPEMRIFAPYLSETLLHRIDLARACGDDWDRKHPDPNLKPPFAWLESGLFSGDDEQAEPLAFSIETTEPEKDGSFRVYVRLTWEESPVPPWIWQIAAIVSRKNGHFVIDDVLYLKDKNRRADSRLSEYLSAGCDGPRWIGFGDQRKDAKPQK